MATKNISKFLITNLCKKSQKFVALPSYKSFFPDKNRKSVYLMLKAEKPNEKMCSKFQN